MCKRAPPHRVFLPALSEDGPQLLVDHHLLHVLQGRVLPHLLLEGQHVLIHRACNTAPSGQPRTRSAHTHALTSDDNHTARGERETNAGHTPIHGQSVEKERGPQRDPIQPCKCSDHFRSERSQLCPRVIDPPYCRPHTRPAGLSLPGNRPAQTSYHPARHGGIQEQYTGHATTTMGGGGGAPLTVCGRAACSQLPEHQAQCVHVYPQEGVPLEVDGSFKNLGSHVATGPHLHTHVHAQTHTHTCMHARKHIHTNR